MRSVLNSILIYFKANDTDSYDDPKIETTYCVSHAFVQDITIKPSFYYDPEDFSSILLKTLENKDGSCCERVLLISK